MSFPSFRVVQSTMIRKRKDKPKQDSEDESDAEVADGDSGEEDDSDSSDDSNEKSGSSSEESESEAVDMVDSHGLPSNKSALVAKFYGENRRIDTVNVLCILHPETVKFSLKKM